MERFDWWFKWFMNAAVFAVCWFFVFTLIYFPLKQAKREEGYTRDLILRPPKPPGPPPTSWSDLGPITSDINVAYNRIGSIPVSEHINYVANCSFDGISGRWIVSDNVKPCTINGIPVKAFLDRYRLDQWHFGIRPVAKQSKPKPSDTMSGDDDLLAINDDRNDHEPGPVQSGVIGEHLPSESLTGDHFVCTSYDSYTGGVKDCTLNVKATVTDVINDLSTYMNRYEKTYLTCGRWGNFILDQNGNVMYRVMNPPCPKAPKPTGYGNYCDEDLSAIGQGDLPKGARPRTLGCR